MKALVLFITLFGFSVCIAQTTDEQFHADSTALRKIKLVRPQFKFDNREAFLQNQVFSVNGFDAGVLLQDRLRFTLGYYTMKGSLKAFKRTVDSIEYGRLVELTYGSVNTEVIWKDTRFISL